ncbi:ubiquitin activating E1 enzyme-like protein [Eremomyces bilateralis CBS 781.70]|uniref:Ubiquitin-like modifier-activating enzyme ATG7 n=1 Tax=Eremomyces bilateralis CBS 781.70 TaxID=1392243 RepID=A0A6G1FU86_9PEZI|nr:ubiquitin activating E1 enzyme-like protein [Eremomyces bilateralis CBS 781.70]KAF1809323.1 ubiquitin activating E1 enzyme-like protein [Eremomyces bilateralis CBS 781.70]
MAHIVQYTPWTSDLELGFFAGLANLKINHDKLDDSARKVLGLYEIRSGDAPERSCRMQIHGNALTADEVPAGYYRGEGIIKNFNTIEDYKNADRVAVVERAGRTIWDAIKDGSIYSCPSLLSSFSAVSFADLKKYKFQYHFNFPALHSDPPWKSDHAPEDPAIHLGVKETTALVDKVQTWRYSVDARQHGFFLAKRVKATNDPPEDDGNLHPRPPKPADELGFSWSVASLSTFEAGFFEGVEPQDRFVCFADPSTYPKNPAWMLRNLLVLIRQRWHLNEVQILCYRDTHIKRDQANSVILHLKSTVPEPVSEHTSSTMPKVTGWERNDRNTLSSRIVDLSEYMDPTRLADQAVDLNLKLIKWRIAPSIDLDIVKNTKCLLLGAGTLGSYVSRNLLGWGVRKITFVDNARVSFSNPVRQPLFDFKDCLEGGAMKAHRAAEALGGIYPGVQSEGHAITVPMLGHPTLSNEADNKAKVDFETLQRLVEEHDAIFLLMDTRESRWLPTLMGKAAGKIVMNAALGFDSYVVMRQGLPPRKDGEAEVGCYFCSDIVAAADSLKDATLDQQCTVTRPGIAPIASALLVELFVSILQHPLGAHAPPSSTPSPLPPSASGDSKPHPLGALPHQLRGFLSDFSSRTLSGPSYPYCSACSSKVIDAYNEGGWDFVRRAVNEKGFVEELCGLAQVHREAEAADAMVEWEDDEDGEELNAEGELL